MRQSRIISLMLIMLLVLAGCNGGGDDNSEEQTDIDPLELLTTASDNIRSAETFRLDVMHGGLDYFVTILLNGQTPTDVAFRRAQAQYVRPDEVQGTVRVVAGIVPVDVDIYANNTQQWVRFVGTDWLLDDFAPGFSAETLIAEDSGFEAALSALTDLTYDGAESLEDGTPVYHLDGTADGASVTALLVGMIEAEGEVPVDVYIHREELYPVRIVITQFELDENGDEGIITWTIDVFDVNDPPDIDVPAGADES